MSSIPSSLLERWRRVPTAVIVDISDGACLIDPDIRPLRPAGQQPRLFGLALTAQCEPPDIGAVVSALDLSEPDDVLVIAAQQHREQAMIGEILGGYLRGRGAAGLICDGAIRDVGTLASWDDFSVYTRFVTPRGPDTFARGRVNGALRFGGRTISAGDLIVGDDDGLASLTAEEASRLIDAAEAKLALEAAWQRRLAEGSTLAEALAVSDDGS